MYRAVYHKFVFLLSFSYAVLISIFVIERKNCFLPYSFQLQYLFIMPLFSNQIVYRHLLTEIPHEYTSISKEIAKDKEDFRISPYHLLLQVVDLFSNGQVIISTLALTLIIFLNRSVIDSYWFIKNAFNKLDVTDSWVGSNFEKNVGEMVKYLGVLNIKYLFVHKDFVDGYDFGSGNVRIDGKIKSDTIISFLSKQNKIKLVKENKYFNLYRVSEEAFYFISIYQIM